MSYTLSLFCCCCFSALAVAKAFSFLWCIIGLSPTALTWRDVQLRNTFVMKPIQLVFDLHKLGRKERTNWKMYVNFYTRVVVCTHACMGTHPHNLTLKRNTTVQKVGCLCDIFTFMTFEEKKSLEIKMERSALEKVHGIRRKYELVCQSLGQEHGEAPRTHAFPKPVHSGFLMNIFLALSALLRNGL